MKLVTFQESGITRLGRLEDQEVVDLSVAAPELPTEMIALLEAGPDALSRAATAEGSRLALPVVALHSPVLRPPKILAVGLNYADHVAETGMDQPAFPMIFNKQSTSITGPYDEIHRPKVSDKLDYEGELAVVIGRRCRHVPRDRAEEVIAGYCIANDVSVRDWQMRVPTMTMGKSFDTHCPLGPALVTIDEVGDGSGLSVTTMVNGETRQQSNTKELIFDSYTLVEHLSTAFTLEPGDVISTGTPGGVGAMMKPPQWLIAGDVIRIEIEGLGRIENTVVNEPDTATGF